MTTATTALAGLAPALATHLREHDFTVAGLETTLGRAAVAALDRSDAATVRRHAREAGPTGLLVRLFIL